MKLYALKIRNSDLELITLLNSGVTPEVEKKTYFIFDATWNSDVPNQIMTERELLTTYDLKKSYGPHLLALKK